MSESRWVNRDGSNNVVGVYANEQFPGQEKLTNEHPDVIAFILARQNPAPLSNSERIDAAFSSTDKDQVDLNTLFDFNNRMLVQESKATIDLAEFKKNYLENKLP